MKIEETNEERKKKEVLESLANGLYPNVDIRNKIAGRSYGEMRKELKDIFGKRLDLISDIHIERFYYMDIAVSHDGPSFEKPDWLDQEKFRRGQRFARDNLAGLFLGQYYGLLCLLCHRESLQTLIATQKSHTPYLAFKRYVGTCDTLG